MEPIQNIKEKQPPNPFRDIPTANKSPYAISCNSATSAKSQQVQVLSQKKADIRSESTTKDEQMD